LQEPRRNNEEAAQRRRPEPRPRKSSTAASRSCSANWPTWSKAVGQRQGKRLLNEEVTEEDIARVVAAWTGIPVNRMLEGEREKLVKMEERLKKRVVDQDEAITAVSNAVRRARSGLQDPNRPIGSFIFLGPDRRRQNRAGPRPGGISL
jgi:ATP-dependent Clp protease ATP-binding subunit ClpB